MHVTTIFLQVSLYNTYHYGSTSNGISKYLDLLISASNMVP